MNIRIAVNQDSESINEVYLSAFSDDEREIVAKLAVDLLYENTTPQTISLIAEINELVVGHIAFSPVKIKEGENCHAYILAPLAVHHGYQKKCIGSQLVEHGLQQLSAMGINVVFVYGDPNYYARFGFSVDTASNYIAPYKLEYPSGWQAIVLNECVIEKAPVAITCVASLSDPKYW